LHQKLVKRPPPCDHRKSLAHVREVPS
jgi:hypothetical protein